MNNRGLIQPSILIHFNDFGFDTIPDIQNLLGRFERLELVYLALEIIYDRNLVKGYRNICARLFPNDSGKRIIFLLDKELNKTHEEIAEHHLVCMQTGLELLKILLSTTQSHTPWNFDNIPNGAESRGINLLTILLLVNERITKDINIQEGKDISDNDTAKDILAKAVATTLVENSDYSNFDILTSPLLYIYKSTLFLEFCASHPVLALCLNKVLDEYGCSDIRTFITVICGIFLESFNSKNNYCRFVFSDNEPAPNFFNKLSFSINSQIKESENVDYSYFRAHPLIRISPNEYVVICVPFLFGKLYQSLIFDLSKVLGDGNRVREIVSTDFSEQKLLFPLLKGSIAPKSPINLSGDDCNKIKKDSAPDYYVRNWDSSFLFELKDYSFRAKEKTALSYEILSNYLYSQFVVKKNGKPGAIKQLVSNIKAIIEKDFAWDKKSRPKHIYPVLVLGNQNYLNYGITYILNRFFKQELNNQGIVAKSINDLLIIDIDTLILYYDLFSRGSFENIVKQYFVKVKKHLKSSSVLERLFGFMQPFPEYLKQKYPLTSEHLIKNIQQLNTWKN